MSTLHGLFLLSHTDMQARPDRTERALRVFFPAESAAHLDALARGDAVLVRSGPREKLRGLASSLSAQGFRTSLRELDPVAG